MNKDNNNKKVQHEENKAIEKEICDVQKELAATLEGFENVVDPDLVDYYSYSYKATEAKYTYLIKKLKTLYRK
ncbi:DUF2508 family protein [Cellulosilyticum sp. ST5]|uniref:DUF2508 family protein n=1 Tax=unclassified Cellulosilyticum TaxID=2643091 RepID=UPI000F8ED931|nr:DUF2508 family protein [Cellulosilyticum sp. WCF-2]QEH68318.1 DUF2508 family protein [Cellulosilyticum sp. WCF-2]